MNYKVLALKWRPEKFDEVIGQDHITLALNNAIKNDRISHAFTFSGPRGVGKTTTARILSRVLNNVDDIDSSFDVIEMDAASNRGIDEIRNLRENASIAPAHGKFKIYIIDEVHMLTKEAFNALLKTLEEPPSHVIFILATTDPYKMPSTILSRTQRYDFRRLSINDIKKQLIIILDSENIKYNDIALNLIARKADGSMRDALGYLDQVINFCGNKLDVDNIQQCLGLVSESMYIDIFSKIIDKDVTNLISLVQESINSGVSINDFVTDFNSFFRSLLHHMIGASSDKKELIDWLTNYRHKITELDVIRIMELLLQFEYKLKFMDHPDLALELLVIKLSNLDSIVDINSIIKNISKDEKQISIENASKKVDFEIKKKDKPVDKFVDEQIAHKESQEDLSSNIEKSSSIRKEEPDFIENKPSEPNDIEVSDKILSIKDIEDTIFDVKEIIRKTNKKTAEFLEDIEIESVKNSVIKIKINNVNNFLFKSLEKDIDLIKSSFNEALEVNYSVSLFKGSEMVVAKDNGTEVKKEEEHKLLYDALNKFEGQIIR